MKKLFLLLLLFTIGYKSYSQVPTIQTPQNSYIVSDLAHLKSYYGYANRLFVYSDRTNYTLCTVCLIDSPYVIQGVGDRKWALEISPSRVRDGLISIGGIQKVDSTITIQHDVLWSINGTLYKRTIDTSFIINSADSGYYRRDLIYVDTSGLIKYSKGIQDNSSPYLPTLPANAYIVTTVDVYGNFISTPVANVVGQVPTWDQTLLAGDTAYQRPTVINNNGSGAFNIIGHADNNTSLYVRNDNNNESAAAGVVLFNSINHIGQWYQSSPNNLYIADGFLIRGSGYGGVQITADTGVIRFQRGLVYTGYRPNVYLELRKDSSIYINPADVDSTASASENILYLAADGTVKRGTVSVPTLGWGLNGNAGTVYTTNFLGTTDNQPLVFKVWNSVSGYIDQVNHSTAFGYQTLPLASHSIFTHSSAFGFRALNHEDINTSGGNTAMGAYSQYNTTTGQDDVSGGFSSLYNNKTGSRIVTSGDNSIFSAVSANNLTNAGYAGLYKFTTGGNIASLGDSSLYNLLSGTYVVGLGTKAGGNKTSLNNTLIVSDSISHFYMLLDSSTNAAPNVVGIASDGYWHRYPLPVYTASNGLTKVGNDIQLGGFLASNTSIITGNYDLQLSGTPTSLGDVLFVEAQNNNNAAVFRSTTSTTGIHYPVRVQELGANDPSNGVGIQFDATGNGFNRTQGFLATQWVDTSLLHAKFIFKPSYNGTFSDAFSIYGNGKVQANQYGHGNFSGTPAYNIQVDANGNLIETTVAGGSSYTASNGLTKVGSDIQLGGALTSNVTISTNTNKQINITAPFYFVNGQGTGIDGTISNQIVMRAKSSDGLKQSFVNTYESSLDLYSQHSEEKIDSSGFTFYRDVDTVGYFNSVTGQLRLNHYGAGTFSGTPVKQLSVTASGNIIETDQPIITSGTAAPTSTPAKVGNIYVDITNKKLYFAAGTTSSADWIIAN